MQTIRTTAALVCLLTISLAASTAIAIDNPPGAGDPVQDDDEPLIEQLRDLFKNEFLELGSLIQTGAQYSESRSGFYLGTARLKVQGALDGGFNYKLQTDFAQSVALKDAMIGYQVSPEVGVTGGQYKTPFSYEYLLSSAATPFINRSRVVRALAPGRQIGTHLTGSVSPTVDLHAGIYNGNGANLGTNNNRFLYVGRLSSTSETDDGIIALGANGAYNDKSVLEDELLIGADFHVVRSAFLFSGEAIYGRQSFDSGVDVTTRNPFGHHLTVGYALQNTETFNQLLLRWDRYTPDTDQDASDQLILGYIGEPTSTIRIEANYVLPVADGGVHQAMLEVQLAF